MGMSPRIMLVAATTLGLVLVLSVALIGLLAYNEKPIPDLLQNIAIGDLTGLLGLLVQTKDNGVMVLGEGEDEEAP